MVADSCQGGAIKSLDDFKFYIGVRQSQGFNTIQFNLIVTPYVGNTNPNYQTNSGIAPFTGAKVSTPNPIYFALMQEFVSLIAQYGMVAWLNPYETGLPRNAGMRDLVAAGVDACRTYGEYVATLFRDYPNVMWHFGNDYEGNSSYFNEAAVVTTKRRIGHYWHGVLRAPWQQAILNAAADESITDLIGRTAMPIGNAKQIFHVADLEIGHVPSVNFFRRAQAFERRPRL